MKAPHLPQQWTVGLQVLVGHDPSVLASLEAGLDGAIAASSSVMPSALLGIQSAFEAKDSEAAQQKLKQLNKWYGQSFQREFCLGPRIVFCRKVGSSIFPCLAMGRQSASEIA